MTDIIIFSLDRWHRGLVGAYGNAAADTPSLDALACAAYVFDRFYANNFFEDAPNLFSALATSSSHTSFLTDDDLIIGAARESFAETQLVQMLSPRVAHSVDATHTARFFQAAIEHLESLSRQESVRAWFHFGGLGTCWDVPLAERARFCDEDDPPPFAEATPPYIEFASRARTLDELDLMHAVSATYAASLALFDEYFGTFLDFLQNDARWNNATLIVFGTRGISLGEHNILGVPPRNFSDKKIAEKITATKLFSELIHVPLIIRPPRGGHPRRILSLAQISDVAKLLQLCKNSSWSDSLIKESFPAHEQIIFRAASENVSEKAIVTPEWFLRQTNHEAAQLFVKPDDRWEVNDVANRCEEVVTQLLQMIESETMEL